MKPIVILDGLDRVGKSTLVNQLANHFGPGAVKHHSSSPPKQLIYPFNLIWEEHNYHELFKAFNEISNTNAVIIDRFHLGVPVYGKRYRNYPESYHIDKIETGMQFNDNVFLLLLTDNSEAIMSRDDGNSFEKTIEDYQETCNQFRTQFDLSKIKNKLVLNISNIGGFANLFPLSINFIENRINAKCK